MVAQIDRIFIAQHASKIPARFISYACFEGRPVTTRGRWINPFVFALFSAAKKLPSTGSVKAPIYITGTGRSGTTILGLIFSTHPDIGFLNEPKAMWHSIQGDEDVIGSYMRETHGRYRLSAEDVTDKTIKDAHKLYRAYLACVHRKRVVDKYPEMIFRVPYILKLFGDAQFIFLSRNGWDACASITSWSKRKGMIKDGNTHDWWGVDQRKWRLMIEQLINPNPEYQRIRKLVTKLTDHRLMAAVEWIVTMREGLKAMERNPGAVLHVKYEDLVNSPRENLMKLEERLFLPHDEGWITYAERVLRPLDPYPSFDMPSEMRCLFDETMNMLGYS